MQASEAKKENPKKLLFPLVFNDFKFGHLPKNIAKTRA